MRLNRRSYNTNHKWCKMDTREYRINQAHHYKFNGCIEQLGSWERILDRGFGSLVSTEIRDFTY